MKSRFSNGLIAQYRRSVISLLIMMVIYAGLIITKFHYVRFSADATLYLNIAEKYIRGDFQNAINGYWGPLLSWLLVPFLYLGASDVFAINALNLIFGIATMTGVWILSLRFEISEKIRSLLLVALLFITLFVSIIQPFDFLLLFLLVFYLSIIFGSEYHRKVLYGGLCGMLGAFAYFTKSYAFPFFLVHFTIMNGAHYVRCIERQDRKKIILNTVVGIGTFFIIVSPWVYLISAKYGHVTISNMGKGNFAAHAPGMPLEGLEVGGPMFHRGFFPPPNETAISVWEDPSFIWQDIESWSPLESFNSFKHFVKMVDKNIFEGIRIYQSFSRLSFTIVIAYALILITQLFKREILRGDLIFAFFTVGLYTGGYLPFHFEMRYLWIVNILLLLMGGYIVNELCRAEFFRSNIRENVLIVVFVLSFTLTPLKAFLTAGNNNINREMYLLSRTLESRYEIKGNVASNREWIHTPVHDSWHKTFRLSYWLGNRYYGQARKDITFAELEKEFDKYDIDYYFYWGKDDSQSSLSSHYKDITNGELTDLKIFNIKAKR